MKKIFTFCLLAFTVAFAQAQEAAPAKKDTSYWKMGGFGQLNFNQVSFTNWAPGGVNSISANVVGRFYANYKKDKLAIDNSFDGVWGLIRTEDQTRKNEDRLEINHKAGYEFAKKTSATFKLNFISQFTPTYAYPEDAPRETLSKFGAPAFTTIGLGIDNKPTDYFSIYFSPVTGKITSVREDTAIDETLYGLDAGSTVRAELGANLTLDFNKEIFKNVTLASKLNLFTSYTGESAFEIDVDWQTGINMQVNKWLAASVTGHLVYDRDILVRDTNDDGEFDESGVQFKQAVSLGLTYKFNLDRN